MRPPDPRLAMLAAAVLVGCPAPPADSGKGSCTDLDPAVEVGNGEVAHTPFTDGDPLTMVHGPQGGWHVWISLGLTNLDPLVEIDVTIQDHTRDETVATLHYAMLTPAPEECVSELAGLFGFLPYDDPATPEDETPPTWRACDVLEVCVVVTDDAGVTVEDCLEGIAMPDPVDGTVSC